MLTCYEKFLHQKLHANRWQQNKWEKKQIIFSSHNLQLQLSVVELETNFATIKK